MFIFQRLVSSIALLSFVLFIYDQEVIASSWEFMTEPVPAVQVSGSTVHMSTLQFRINKSVCNDESAEIVIVFISYKTEELERVEGSIIKTSLSVRVGEERSELIDKVKVSGVFVPDGAPFGIAVLRTGIGWPLHAMKELSKSQSVHFDIEFPNDKVFDVPLESWSLSGSSGLERAMQEVDVYCEGLN